MGDMNKYEEAKNATFNLYNTPVFAEKISPGQVGENILTYMTSKSDILKTKKLEPGEFFSGVVYCTKTFSAANVNEPNKYDVTFTLIDGDGVQFTAKKWGCDEKIEHINTPLYVEGTTVSYADGVLRYRIDAFKRYMTEVPKSLFIKEIDGLNEQSEILLGYVNEIKTPCLKKLIDLLLNQYGFLQTLKETTYKHNIGTKLGAKILMCNTLIKMADSYRDNMSQNLDRDIYIALPILYLIDLTIKQGSQSSNMIKSTQVSTNILKVMYDSGCFDTVDNEQEKIQAVFNGLIDVSNTKDIFNIPPECLLFNNLIQTIEREMRCLMYV